MFQFTKQHIAGLSVLFLTLLVTGPGNAYQPDAPFRKAMQENAEAWKKEDRAIDKKLAELEKRFGKKPNIIYVLGDDVGWGELGSYLGGKLRGTPTPNLDGLAQQGMQFLAHYSEPSCTPTRLALLTGRHPVRTGVDIVLWPGQTQGLAPEEVTVAEMLSAAGYHTAMFGKWHVGDWKAGAPCAGEPGFRLRLLRPLQRRHLFLGQSGCVLPGADRGRCRPFL